MNNSFIKKSVVCLLIIIITTLLAYNKFGTPVIATVCNLCVLLFVPQILWSGKFKSIALKYTLAILLPIISLIIVLTVTGNVFMKQTIMFSAIMIVFALIQLYKEKHR